jgi:hypothetical protein
MKMQRVLSTTLLTAIKDIVIMLKEEEQVLPLYQRKQPVFIVPLTEIIVTPDPSSKIEAFRVD